MAARLYIYIPIGGNRKGKVRKYINLVVTFLVSGIWHGVGIHYIAWGMYHAICQIIGEITHKPKERLYKALKVNTEVFSFGFMKQVVTFALVAYSWLLFRADGMTAAVRMTKSNFRNFMCFGEPQLWLFSSPDSVILIISIFLLLTVSVLQTKYHLRETLGCQNLWFRWTVYLMALYSIIIFGVYGSGYDVSAFLYMQY